MLLFFFLLRKINCVPFLFDYTRLHGTNHGFEEEHLKVLDCLAFCGLNYNQHVPIYKITISDVFSTTQSFSFFVELNGAGVKLKRFLGEIM